MAYTGRYEVKGDTVQHTIYSSLNPNLVGTTQMRRVTLDGDDLTLATLPDAKGNYLPHPLAAGGKNVSHACAGRGIVSNQALTDSGGDSQR